MKTWILQFLRDERGAEGVELAITGAVVAGGAVAGFLLIKQELGHKQAELARKLHNASAD
jgi:Flp pilus assembly pilin Flp